MATGVALERLKYRLLTVPALNWLNRTVRPSNWLARLRTPFVIRRALASGRPVRLHLGCGRSRSGTGWIHGDIHRGDVFVDVRRRLPFPDGSVDLVFSEHLIEHLKLPVAGRFLKECHRVLKPGGWMRHSTPDLRFYVDLYVGNLAGFDLDAFYSRIRHVRRQTPLPCVYMNEVLTLGGHAFIFDEGFLSQMLREGGFSDVRRVPYGRSEVPALNGMEQHTSSPWMQRGTLVMEARKPG